MLAWSLPIDKSKTIDDLLDRVGFSDGDAADWELNDIKTVHGLFTQVKNLVKKILDIKRENQYFIHMIMRDYNCENVKLEVRYYNGRFVFSKLQ